MMDIITKILDQFIGGAERLGALGVSAVWAFFVVILIAYIAWDLKAKKEAAELAWQARIKESEADGMVANAIEKLADQIKELRYKLKCVGGEDA